MKELKLGLDHQVVCYLVDPAGDEYATCYLPTDDAHVTYAVNRENGTCFWGHYMIGTPEEAMADLIARSGLNLDRVVAQLLAMKDNGRVA